MAPPPSLRKTPATSGSPKNNLPSARPPTKYVPIGSTMAHTSARKAVPTAASSPLPRGHTPTPDGEDTEDGIVVIARSGDLILDIQHTHTSSTAPTSETTSFRVSTTSLKAHSTYFARLLNPAGPFSEGASVSSELATLRTTYSDITSAPASKLPRVKIEEVGQISKVSSVRPLILDFLGILHGSRGSKQGGAKVIKTPIKNVANLVVVADRFGATEIVGRWVTNNISATGIAERNSRDMSEEQVRMRLCIGVLLGLDKWVTTWSLQLLLSGSSRWSPDAIDTSETEAFWFSIPRGVEEELQHRRTHILLTVASLQSHLLSAFASKARQCRLGYDSSPQCDSFQLGEFVKFLSRIGALDLRPSFSGHDDDDEAAEEYQGDIRTLVATLRTCPAYQVDTNHGHCGPKKGLTAGLDFIERLITDSGAGLCWRCWSDPRAEHRWTDGKRALRFDRKLAAKGGLRPGGHVQSCAKEAEHAYAREFFLARDKAWEDTLETLAANPAARLSSQGWVLKHPDLLLHNLQRAGV